MKARPRILLVGAGGYGRLYLEYLTTHDTGADLVAVCDIDPGLPDRLPAIRQNHLAFYRDLESFFARDRADLAILVSPVHFHTEMVLTCLQQGTCVLCEKPLCLTREEALTMEDAAKKSGCFVAVGYQLNYRRDVLALKKDLLVGRFGRPVRFSVYHGFRRGASYYARNDWAGQISCHGREVFDSPFTNACAHHFQMLTFLLGDAMDTACPLRDVEAELYRANPSIENYDIAALRFHTREGVPLLYYTAHPIPSDCWGPRGVLEFENAVITYRGEIPVFQGRLKNGTPFDYHHVDPGSHMQKLLDAIHALQTGEPPVCGPKADLPHIQAVRMVQENPIRPVRAELIHRVKTETDTFYYVKDLEQTLERCAEQCALPAELGIRLD